METDKPCYYRLLICKEKITRTSMEFKVARFSGMCRTKGLIKMTIFNPDFP